MTKEEFSDLVKSRNESAVSEEIKRIINHRFEKINRLTNTLYYQSDDYQFILVGIYSIGNVAYLETKIINDNSIELQFKRPNSMRVECDIVDIDWLYNVSVIQDIYHDSLEQFYNMQETKRNECARFMELSDNLLKNNPFNDKIDESLEDIFKKIDSFKEMDATPFYYEPDLESIEFAKKFVKLVYDKFKILPDSEDLYPDTLGYVCVPYYFVSTDIYINVYTLNNNKIQYFFENEITGFGEADVIDNVVDELPESLIKIFSENIQTKS